MTFRNFLLGLLSWSLLVAIFCLAWLGGWFWLGTQEDAVHRIQTQFWYTLVGRVFISFMFATPAILALALLGLTQQLTAKRLLVSGLPVRFL
ncbi:MAG: hypothetical protein H7330_04945 [Hymenobacteraceae bacterium]|nr:hypothetical protein [Hymenobacteraceae bacterium]